MNTTSSSSGPPPNGQNMLHRLPDELLIEILELAPSLSALWSLINSSGRLAAVFRRYGAQITEAVLRSTLPPQTQGLMKAVLRLRAALYPSGLAQAREVSSLRPRSPPMGAVAPDVVRGAVRLAHQIHVLAYECIRHYIHNCTRMSAGEMANPACVASGAVGAPPTWKRPAGRPQRLQDTGAPFLVEEQLVAMNLWRLQYYLEIRAALDTGRLGWSAEDREVMLSLSAWRFYRLEVKSHKREQLEVVMRYVQLRRIQLTERQQRHGSGFITDLPRPSTTPNPFNVPYAPSHRAVLRLEYKPRGWSFVSAVSGIPRYAHYSPLYGVTLGTYRSYGFAVFHDKRMVDLGLLPP